MLSTREAVVEILPSTGGESTAQEVLRNLQVLYGTVAGEQALDRDFGIDGSIIDGPQENAQALLVAEYVRKTERYEPRAKVARVEWTADKAADGMMIPKVVVELVYETGMPIGNLTSQLFANIYLNELDQYCKHKLKIHYYIRYMDDVIILGPNKWVLREWKEEIEKFLEKELHLDLNTKTSIRPMKSGIEFVGVKIWPTHMKLRKSTVRRIKRETRKISRLYASGDMARDAFDRRVTSIRGMLKHAECASLRWRLNEIYREEMERAKNEKKEAEYEPFADHPGTGERNGNSSESD